LAVLGSDALSQNPVAIVFAVGPVKRDIDPLQLRASRTRWAATEQACRLGVPSTTLTTRSVAETAGPTAYAGLPPVAPAAALAACSARPGAITATGYREGQGDQEFDADPIGAELGILCPGEH
jgi:hypothetical protein